MLDKEKDIITKSVFSEVDIESSSDLIVTLYELSRKIDHELFLLIDPIYRWEYQNWHDMWEANVNFIGKKLPDLDEEDYNEILLSYDQVLAYFLHDNTMNKMFKMDDNDDVGWKIYKELTAKRELCKRELALLYSKRG